MISDFSPFDFYHKISHSRNLQEFRAESIFIPVFLIWSVICLCTICINCKRNLDHRPIQVPGPRADGRVRESVTRSRTPGTGVVQNPVASSVQARHQDKSKPMSQEMRRRVLQNLFPEQYQKVCIIKNTTILMFLYTY